MNFALSSLVHIADANRLHIPVNPLSIRNLNVRNVERWLISIVNVEGGKQWLRNTHTRT